MGRLPYVLVSLSLAVGGVAVAQPANAAGPPKSCGPQANRVAAAKRKLAKAKTPKAKRAAKKQLRVRKRTLSRCKAKAIEKPKPAPAPAPPAPAPTPSPAPVPTPVPTPGPGPVPTPVPTAPISLLPAAPTASDGLTFTVAAREVAPADYHYQLTLSAVDGESTPGCGLRANQAIGDLATTATVAFAPQQAKTPVGGAAAWCTGRWVAALLLVPSGTSSGMPKSIASLPFAIAP